MNIWSTFEYTKDDHIVAEKLGYSIPSISYEYFLRLADNADSEESDQYNQALESHYYWSE